MPPDKPKNEWNLAGQVTVWKIINLSVYSILPCILLTTETSPAACDDSQMRKPAGCVFVFVYTSHKLYVCRTDVVMLCYEAKQ